MAAVQHLQEYFVVAVFTGEHVDRWMMLAAASTLAGKLPMLGAASIIVM
ncbi:MAG TPA: hypothetical protein VF172_01580 [Nitrososphaera sp.]